VGVNDRIRWEVQWHPTSGARIRRLAITSRGVRRLLLTVGIAGWVVVAGGLFVVLDGVRTHFAVEAAGRQNTSLRAQQDALREQALELAVRLAEGVERGRGVVRSVNTPGPALERQSLRLPATDARNDAILAWLSEQSALLEALGHGLPAGRVATGGMQASLPVAVRKGLVRTGNPAALQVADMGSATRQEAAPASR